MMEIKPARASDSFISQQFAAWLGHPECRATSRVDFLRMVFTVEVGPVSVDFPWSTYQRLQCCAIERMPNEFESLVNR